MAITLFLLYVVFTFIVLSFRLKPLLWEIGSGVYLLLSILTGLSWLIALPLWLMILSSVALLRSKPLRGWIAGRLFLRAKRAIPRLSKTEEEALNAGDTWFEQGIFVGEPNWSGLSALTTNLTEEEQHFIDHETNSLCSMLDEWTITQTGDLPESVWAFMKEKGFFGLVIHKKYGGKGFSARAHSEIVMRIASRSGVGAVTVMVPNSLGPGELLHHYGTEEQKDYFLPRLAQGIDIPCFALTEPEAGSDATSIQSDALVVEKTINGESVLGLQLTLNKRWITLAPVATLIGLAVNLRDPEGLLKGKGQEGITCLLIPRDTPNLEIGNRHLPAEQPFMNGTIRGEDVFVPITTIIGGLKEAGHGWQMLVECLSIGRSISLPALGAASSSVAYVTSGAFSRIRRQFNVEIAQFEGIEEKLAEIAGLNFLIMSTRLLTLAAVDDHKKPSVASAITKYFNTELARIVLNDAMDVHGGRTVVVGPRNYLTNFYQGIPISITVEGANIMTRNLLIFGQGSMACHPYIRDEFYAISQNDEAEFETILWKHVSYFIRNLAKTMLSAWTGGRFIQVPKHPMKRACQQLSRLSFAYAFLSDVSLIILGGSLKRKERLSARLADGMSYLYIAMAALRMVEAGEGNPDEIAHAQWGVAYCFYHAQAALIGLCKNFPSKILGFILRCIAFPWGQSMAYPNDKLDHHLANLMTKNNDHRNKLLKGIYLSDDAKDPIDRVELPFQALITHAELYKKVKGMKKLNASTLKAALADAVAHGDLTKDEMLTILSVEQARWDAIQVDEFSFDAVKKKTFSSITDRYKNPLA